MLARCRRALALASAMALLVLATEARAQMPNIDQTFLNAPPPLSGNKVRFCIYPHSAIAGTDRAIAQALGDALLFEVEIIEVEAPITIEGIDTIPISFEDLYLLLDGQCNAFMGLDLAPEVYPDWLALTRAYLVAPYVVLARAGEYGDFSELTPGQSVATQSLSVGDIRLGAYLNALPQTDRLRRRPYPTTHLQIERLKDGTVDAAIVWQPWLAVLGDLADGLEILPTSDLAFGQRMVGIGLSTRDTYLRSALDNAIATLEADGTLAALAP